AGAAAAGGAASLAGDNLGGDTSVTSRLPAAGASGATDAPARVMATPPSDATRLETGGDEGGVGGADVDRDGEAPGRRRSAVLLVVALLVLAGAGLAIWGLQRDTTDPGGQAAPPVASSSPRTPSVTRPPTSPRTSRAESPSPSTTAPTSTRPATPSNTPSTAPSPAPSTTVSGRPTDAELARAVRDYYALLPGNTDAGWARLTDRYRSTTSGSRATYERFWGSVSSVDVRQATGSAPRSVVATLRYAFDDGRRFEERTAYSLVDDGGILKIDRSSVLSSRQL
ncbi:hypothetical protein AB4Y83_21435, partial [Terrabacter sp. RAF57]